MSSDSDVAKERYTRALFNAAEKAEETDAVNQDLKELSTCFKSSGLKRFLGDPQYSAEDKTRVVQALGKKFKSRLAMHFIELLLKKHRVILLEPCQALFNELVREKKGVVEAQVWVAHKPGKSLEKKIESALHKISDKKVQLSIQIDSGMIGGIVVRMKHYLLDTSVSSRLRQFETQLLKASVL